MCLSSVVYIYIYAYSLFAFASNLFNCHVYNFYQINSTQLYTAFHKVAAYAVRGLALLRLDVSHFTKDGAC